MIRSSPDSGSARCPSDSGEGSRRPVRVPCVAVVCGSWNNGLHCLESTGAGSLSGLPEAVRTTPFQPPHLYSVCPLNHRLSQIRQSA